MEDNQNNQQPEEEEKNQDVVNYMQNPEEGEPNNMEQGNEEAVEEQSPNEEGVNQNANVEGEQPNENKEGGSGEENVEAEGENKDQGNSKENEVPPSDAEPKEGNLTYEIPKKNKYLTNSYDYSKTGMTSQYNSNNRPGDMNDLVERTRYILYGDKNEPSVYASKFSGSPSKYNMNQSYQRYSQYPGTSNNYSGGSDIQLRSRRRPNLSNDWSSNNINQNRTYSLGNPLMNSMNYGNSNPLASSTNNFRTSNSRRNISPCRCCNCGCHCHY